jgi:RTX calcium-binding nonapeptide repeat (4 copies)
MRKVAFIISFAVLAGVLVASVSAGTAGRVIGTAKNDVLKGTVKADILDGRAGNDTLYGYAGSDVLVGGKGNDRLVGGKGRDQLRCGSGRDTALADATDTVGSDCETVRGLPAPPPPPPPPAPPPPPPPPPPAPPAQRAVAGHYCGFTNQGKSICFDVTPDSTRVANFATGSELDCETATATFGLSFDGSALIQSDLSFSFTYNGAITSDDTHFANISTNYSVSGRFDTAGNATGVLNLNRLSFDYDGRHYDCAAAGYAWQARAGA